MPSVPALKNLALRTTKGVRPKNIESFAGLAEPSSNTKQTLNRLRLRYTIFNESSHNFENKWRIPKIGNSIVTNDGWRGVVVGATTEKSVKYIFLAEASYTNTYDNNGMIDMNIEEYNGKIVKVNVTKSNLRVE